jgi:hypothetical protein
MRALLCLVVLSSGCIDDIDPRWTLDHDHVIAARATPPRVRAGEETNIDALVAHAGRAPTVEDPMSAELDNPPDELEHALSQTSDGQWHLAAPADLPDDAAPVPVDVVLTFPNQSQDRASLDPFKVKKTVWVGEPSANPADPVVVVDGAEVGDELVVTLDRDVYVETPAAPGIRVNWLTNVGTLYQDDESRAYVHVAPDDAHAGQLVVVIRDDAGGVAWRVLPFRAE